MKRNLLSVLVGVVIMLVLAPFIIEAHTSEQTAGGLYHGQIDYSRYEVEEKVVEEPEFVYLPTYDPYPGSLEYLAACVEAEAGNQSELGRRLVCDVILNRYDKGGYTCLEEVIDEDDQFSVVSDGRIHTVKPTQETYDLVVEELLCKTNEEVLHFRTEHYHDFGTPLFVEGDHYFSR